MEVGNEGDKKQTRAMGVLTVLTLAALVAGWVGESVAASKSFAWSCFAVAYLAGGYYTVQAAWESIREWQFDVNFLMIVAALGAAYVGEPKEGAILMFLFSLSNTLEHYAMGRTKSSIHSLMALSPKTARRLGDQREEQIPIDSIRLNDLVFVKPGEAVSVDGVVEEGFSSVNEVSLTGESFPVRKEVGSKVFAGTMNENGFLKVRVKSEVKDFTLSQIIRVVQEARERKARSQDFTDRIIGQYYAISVCFITVLAFAVPYWLWGWEFQKALYRAMTLMVVASPCALVISIPSALLSSLSTAARKGVLFKGGKAIESLSKVKTLVMDKTGTLTQGTLSLTTLHTLHVLDGVLLSSMLPEMEYGEDPKGDLGKVANTLEKRQLLHLAASIEQFSNHPLAACIHGAGMELGLPLLEVRAFDSITGKGIRGESNGIPFEIGRPFAFAELDKATLTLVENYQKQAQSIIVLSSRRRAIGLLGVSDRIRREATTFVAECKKVGIERFVLLTGDHEHSASLIAGKVGIEEVHSQQSPEDKSRKVRELEESSPTGMIGDGINDAPSLATASVGIAMGLTGTDVALESADVVLVRDNLGVIPEVILLARRTTKIIRQNMVFAFVVMGLLIAFSLMGKVALPLGVVGHEGSTLLVVLNSLRLLRR